jgi:aspartate racemase
MSYPFADMMSDTLDDKQKTLIQKQLSSCFNCLTENKIQIAAIACNTLHEFVDGEAFQGLTFVHMIREIGPLLRQNNISKALVLCSSTSARCKLHQRFFDYCYFDGVIQSKLQNLIDIILAGQQCREDSQQLAEQLNAQLRLLQKVEGEKIGIVLGCTEFSVINEQFPLQANGLSEDFLVFDPNQIVAEKICSLIFNK